MEEFLATQPPFVRTAMGYAQQGRDLAIEWLTSPAAWSQFALLIIAFMLAWFARRALTPMLVRLLTPAESSDSYLAQARHFALQFLPLLLPVLAYFFTSIGEQATRAAFGSGAVIAFGKNIFLLIAVRILVDRIIKDPFMKLLGRYILIPVAVLNVFGLLSPAIAYLDA
ncbi:MAG: hypothetical protein WA921_12900, partial [Ahrensia sp.]